MNAIENAKLCIVYENNFYSSVDLTYCYLYLDLMSCRLPSTLVSVNNQKEAPCGRNHEICKALGKIRSAIKYIAREYNHTNIFCY